MNPDPHLDAETLAAWAEDRLPAVERDALEAHAADCGRCQALLAAMVRTEPPVEAQPAWWRRISPLGWAVPLTAAAAALIWLVASPHESRPKVSKRRTDHPGIALAIAHAGTVTVLERGRCVEGEAGKATIRS